jgi:hypothetical protein
MKNFLLIVLIITGINSVKSQETKVIYQYKKYEKVDLGDLEVKGNVLAPGDITIMERDRARFQRELFDKPDFDQEMRFTILNLR